VDRTPELEIPPIFASFTVDVPSTFALDKSVREAGTVGVVWPGIGVGVVWPGIGIVESLRQMRPAVALKETEELHDPQPFLFFARAETWYLFDFRFFNSQLFTRPTTVQDNAPTLTCVERTGDARFVEARLNSTVRSSFPERTFAEMTVIEGLEGFAVTDSALALVAPITADTATNSGIQIRFGVLSCFMLFLTTIALYQKAL
jgi:hypothetical protein